MLTALELRFSLDPINVSLADTSYLTLDNDLITGWQRALVETLLITIQQRTDYIGSLLLFQHYLTLKQPRYRWQLNYLRGLQKAITHVLRF